MNSNSSKTIIAVVVIVFGFAAVFGLSNFLETNRPEMPVEYIDEDLALQGENLKGWSLGFEGLIADWYWVRSLQYMGEKISSSEEEVLDIGNLQSLNPRLLYPLLDNASTVDPKFMVIYSYGAVVLPAIDAKQAIEIAEKGIKNNPDEWRLYQHLGYIYWRMNDFEKASETYQKGSTIKNAPPFMKLMAARMKSEGGSRDIARDIYQQMFNEAEDSNTKENAQLRLLQLDSLDEQDAIRIALEKFKTKTERCVNNWKELLPSLQNVKLPNGKDFRIDKDGNLVDPSDAPYALLKGKCDVAPDTEKSKIPKN